jgi:hypothetical protein
VARNAPGLPKKGRNEAARQKAAQPPCLLSGLAEPDVVDVGLLTVRPGQLRSLTERVAVPVAATDGSIREVDCADAGAGKRLELVRFREAVVIAIRLSRRRCCNQSLSITIRRCSDVGDTPLLGPLDFHPPRKRQVSSQQSF